MVKTRLAGILLALSLSASLAVLPACSSSPASDPAQSSAASASTASQADATAADITVTVTIASPKTDDSFQSVDSTIAVPEGSSALDALQEVTPDVVVDNGQFGAFVASINGLANGTAGAQSGWTYTLNGDYVAESAADCILNDGDTVSWEFYV